LMLSSHLRLELPSGFPTKILHSFRFPLPCYMPITSHPTSLDRSNYTWRRVHVAKLLNMQLSLRTCHFICLDPNILSEQSSQTPSVYVPPFMSETKFHAHTEPHAKL
jgi:hypothetical protein